MSAHWSLAAATGAARKAAAIKVVAIKATLSAAVLNELLQCVGAGAHLRVSST